MKNALKALKKVGVELMYKKVDSTIRGEIRAELDATINEFGVTAVIVVPVFLCAKQNGHKWLSFGQQDPSRKNRVRSGSLNHLNEFYISTLIG